MKNHRSSNADVSALALIMVDIVKDKATKTLNHINDMLKEDYDVPEATEALTKGAYIFAEDSFNDAAIVADSSGESFSSGSSTLTDLNKDMHDVSAVARAILRTLL
ncbi:cell wall / vacuolar inhibitor of fructosidase 1-like [Ziziphus jujuba]|uniref:Cell wall / vacuolar inhibitor of fructosidase 1-like n=1 Tax=Ziziphus jujuba TaxID=326968 RepID=A0ABM3ZWV1_ZIZJJ|nr:cell wall / vacuolar inhibitor of fructosidase 1-like [Ziziphus jujuba]